MKRKLLLGSTMLSALLAGSASGQVVNFHDSFNYAMYKNAQGLGPNYNSLFAGQGAYPDPGNQIWNGFTCGHDNGFGNVTYWMYYSGAPGLSYATYTSYYNNNLGWYYWFWPQQVGNPGNPYAQYGNYGDTFMSGGPGTSLFLYPGAPGATHYNGTSSGQFLGYTGNATSAGQITPITISVLANGDFAGTWYQNSTPTAEVNGSPMFLMSSCAVKNGGDPNLVVTLGNVAPGNYGLYIYNATEYNDRGAMWSLEGANGGVAHNGINTCVNEDNPDGIPDPNGFVEGSNYMIFENVTPDSSGNIVITGVPILNPYSGNDGETDLAGLQLIASPLPTEAGLNSASNVYLGQNALFSFSPVFADESTTTPSFRWQYSSDNGNTWGSVGANSSGVTTPSLTITSATTNNAGLYRCTITDNVTLAVGTTPASSLSILTSTNANILQIGDALTEVNDNITFPGNTIPAPVGMVVSEVEDQTLYQYENFGTNGSWTTSGFTGPAGFIVQPAYGESIVSGLRIFASSTHPEADPINYTLQGSTVGPSGPWTTLSTGTISLPMARNAGGGPINVGADVLQEIDFTNTQYALAYQLTFNDVRDDSSDTNGVQIAEVQFLGIVGGPPHIVSGPAAYSVAPACPVGAPVTLTVDATGTDLAYEWFLNGSSVVQNGPSPSYTFDALEGTNTYSVVISGTYAPPATNAPVTVVGISNTPSALVTFNSGTGWSLNAGAVYNGAPQFVTSDELELTDGGANEWTSSFYTNLQYIGGFIASFEYEAGGSADGITFCLQNSPLSTNALGTNAAGGGGGLGYDQITPSFAFEMNIYTGAHGGEGIQYGVNGSTPDTTTPPPTAPYVSVSPITLSSGDLIYVQLRYLNGVLNVFMEDTATLAQFSTNTTVDLQGVLGGPSAYVGFTGGDGGDTAIQIVSDFQYTSTTTPVLSIAKAPSANVMVSWPISVSPLFNLYESSSLLGPWTAVGITPTISGCDYEVTVPASSSAQYFELSLDPPVQ